MGSLFVASCASRGGVPPTKTNAPGEAGVGASSDLPPKCSGASGGVKIDEVIDRTFEGANARAELKSRYQALQADLDREQAVVKKEHDELEKASKTMNKDELATKTASLQERLAALQVDFVAKQKELTELEATLVGKARARVRAFVTSRGPEIAGQLIAIVADDKTTLWLIPGCEKAWIAPSVNVTDAVVKLYESTHGAVLGETTM